MDPLKLILPQHTPSIQRMQHERNASPALQGLHPVDTPTLGPSGGHRCARGAWGSHLACRWVSAGQGGTPLWASWDCWKTEEGLLWLRVGAHGSWRGSSLFFGGLGAASAQG